MGQVGGTSSMEVGLQRAFLLFSTVIWFVSSLVLLALLLYASLLWTAALLYWSQFIDWESGGGLTWNHLIRGENFHNNILNVDHQCLSKKSYWFIPKKTFIFLLYIDFKYFPTCSSTSSIKTLYIELWLNDSTCKGKFWLNPCRQYFGWDRGNDFLKFCSPLSQSDGLHSL